MLRVSIIIPVYNDAARLKKCLEALKSQSVDQGDFEVLVIDNNSTEDIREIVEQFGGKNCIYLKEERIGSYAARNKGLDVAKGEIIAFTDSDCIPANNWLEQGIACLESVQRPGVIGGQIKLIYQNKKLSNVEVYEKYTAFRQQENLATGTCVGANWFSYKSVLLNFGGFDANLKSGGDTDLSGRISRGGYEAVYCANAIIYHPSRQTYKAIGTKYARLYGGKFDRCKSNKLKFSVTYYFKFVFRRLRWNLKKMIELPINESFGILIVNLYLFGRLAKEVVRLNTGKQSERN